VYIFVLTSVYSITPRLISSTPLRAGNGGINMAPKWYEYAQKQLKKDEHIQKNFEGRLDGNFGYLFLTDHRLLFVKQEGFLRKSYEIILDLPKEDVEEISQVESYKMEILETGGERHVFESDIGVSSIEKNINELLAAD